MLRVRTWCKNHRTFKHNGHKRGDQSFFCVQLSCPVLSSQLSHSGSEFDQCVKPTTDKASCDEHERLSKHPGTCTHAHLHMQTYAPMRTHFFFYVSASHTLSFLRFGQKGSKTQNQRFTQGCPPPLCTSHSLSESHSSQ